MNSGSPNAIAKTRIAIPQVYAGFTVFHDAIVPTKLTEAEQTPPEPMDGSTMYPDGKQHRYED